DLYNQIINTYPKYSYAYLSLAGVHGQMKDYKSSTDNYEKAIALDSNYTNDYKLPYSINLAGQGKFNQALSAINSLLSKEKVMPATKRAADYRKKTYEFAVDYAAKHPGSSYQFTPINLGDSINSPRSEYYPSITIDDSLFIYSRNVGGGREDFMKSTILPDHKYGKSKLVEGSLNDEPSKGALNISQDGEWVIFAGNFPGKG